jgi:hypothetical protein
MDNFVINLETKKKKKKGCNTKEKEETMMLSVRVTSDKTPDSCRIWKQPTHPRKQNVVFSKGGNTELKN